MQEKSAVLYRYNAIVYVPDVVGRVGVTFALIVVSDSKPDFLVSKRISSWAPVLELDSEADVELLAALFDELLVAVRNDFEYLTRAVEWELSVRVLPPREFSTSDFQGTFSLLADAEFGLGALPEYPIQPG